MSQLLAICFDSTGSPAIRLTDEDRPGTRPPRGVGMAWYPSGDSDAAMFKDPTSDTGQSMSRMLSEWRRFNSVIFICHVVTTGRRRTQQDTHPFRRSHAGRSWLMAHNGKLEGDLHAALPLGDQPVFEPLGQTDSEHALCWLLTRIRALDIRALADVGWERLLSWFRELNALGSANIVISDGHDVVAYRDQGGFNGLSWARRRPPHAVTEIKNDAFALNLEDSRNTNRTMVLFATQPMEETGWTSMVPGHMIVARRGAVMWDSAALDSSIPGMNVEPGDVAGSPVVVLSDPADGLIERECIADMPVGPFSPVSSGQHQSLAPAPESGVVDTSQRFLSVLHETVYRYDKPVERSEHVFRLRPVHDDLQGPVESELTIEPAGRHFDYEDVFGNRARSVSIDAPYHELRLLSRSTVRLKAIEPLENHPTLHAQRLPLVWMPWQREMMQPYLLPLELPEVQLRELTEFAMSFVERQNHSLVETLLDMNRGVFRDFTYLSGSTTLETTPFEVLMSRQGVCQDFANLMICLARLLNIPARYRVGYIYTGGNYENKAQSDASHAWLELYLPGVGWRGFDPTNGCEVGLDHIRIACGRNYRDATPTSGTIFAGGGTETLEINVKVTEVAPPLEAEASPSA